MPNPEHGGLGPELERRLKDALDGLTPPSSSPRYQSVPLAPARWRLAPVALASAAACLLALLAVAATGSASPVVWTQRAASTIQSIGRQPEVTPSPQYSTGTEPGDQTPGAGSPSPERESPEPEHGTVPSPTQDAAHEASPTPGTNGSEQSPSPSPTQSPSSSGAPGDSSPSPSATSSSDFGQ